MPHRFRHIARTHADRKSEPGFLSLEYAQKVRRFHQSFPMYQPTPLRHLPNTAKALGLGDICIKDESFRFGLNAFKVLGGSYAMGRELARRLGMAEDEMTCEALASPQTRQKLGELTFVTATDGNHGRGVA